METGIQQLASQYVEEHEHAEQQPALTAQQDEIITEDEPEIVAEQNQLRWNQQQNTANLFHDVFIHQNATKT